MNTDAQRVLMLSGYEGSDPICVFWVTGDPTAEVKLIGKECQKHSNVISSEAPRFLSIDFLRLR